MSAFSTWYSMSQKISVYYLGGKEDAKLDVYVQRVVGTSNFNVEICVSEDDDNENCIMLSLEDFLKIAEEIKRQASAFVISKYSNFPPDLIKVIKYIAIELDSIFMVTYDEKTQIWSIKFRGDLRSIASNFIDEISTMLKSSGYILLSWAIMHDPIQEFLIRVRREKNGH